MSMIVWNESFVLGMQDFDEQHQHLVDLLNKAYDEFTAAGAPTEHVKSILNDLIDYSTYHFEAEESWMHEQSYPMLGELRAEHDKFLDRIVDMLKSNHGDKSFLLMEVLMFLQVWLTDHINKSVADYSRYSAAISK